MNLVLSLRNEILDTILDRPYVQDMRTASLMPDTALNSSTAARSLLSAQRGFSFRERVVILACFEIFRSSCAMFPGRALVPITRSVGAGSALFLMSR